MSAPAAVPLEDRFAPAIAAVNAWRGRCLASFTRAERVVSEALVSLGTTDGKPVLPLLVGQRFDTFEHRLTGRDGVKDVLAAIRVFAAHDQLRAFLCHGDCQVLLDRRGRWHAVFALLAPCQGVPTRRTLLVDADEAVRLAHELQRDQQRLTAQIGRAASLVPKCDASGAKAALRVSGLAH